MRHNSDNHFFLSVCPLTNADIVSKWQCISSNFLSLSGMAVILFFESYTALQISKDNPYIGG